MVERDVFLCSLAGGSVRNEARGFWTEIEKRADGGAGAATGAEFHDLAEQYECGDGGGGFEVDVGVSGHAVQAQRDGENLRGDSGNYAVEVRDAGTEPDQGEHVGAAVDQRCPEALEEWEAAPEDDGRGKSEFEPDQNDLF